MLGRRTAFVLLAAALIPACVSSTAKTISMKHVEIDLGDAVLSFDVPTHASSAAPRQLRKSALPGDEWEAAANDTYLRLFLSLWDFKPRPFALVDGSVTMSVHLWAAPEGLGDPPTLDRTRVAILEAERRFARRAGRPEKPLSGEFESVQIGGVDWLSYRTPAGAWRRWNLAFPIDNIRYIEVSVDVSQSRNYRQEALAMAQSMLDSLTVSRIDD